MANSAMGNGDVSQALAFLRQLLIVGYFGVSRELYRCLTAYVGAAMFVLSFGVIFDSTTISYVVQFQGRNSEHPASERADLSP